MKLTDFYYELPKELIAQDPLEDRSASRLMVIDRYKGTVKHDVFRNIADYLNPGDCLVINDTRVIPARLFGTRQDTKAAVEILLLNRKTDTDWECLVKPGKKAREGAVLDFGGDGFNDAVMTGEITGVLPDGNRIISFCYNGIFEEVLDRLGQMPLPPYITHKLKDRERYQTVYAVHDGSAAAPRQGCILRRNFLKR